jgi:hypothetical protein
MLLTTLAKTAQKRPVEIDFRLTRNPYFAMDYEG